MTKVTRSDPGRSPTDTDRQCPSQSAHEFCRRSFGGRPPRYERRNPWPGQLGGRWGGHLGAPPAGPSPALHACIEHHLASGGTVRPEGRGRPVHEHRGPGNDFPEVAALPGVPPTSADRRRRPARTFTTAGAGARTSPNGCTASVGSQGGVAVSKRRPCIPARFVVACARGHLDEFPYVDFVHRKAEEPCQGAQLEMRDAGSVLGPRVTISCTAGCKSRRNISEAAGTRGATNLPLCRGRHPHLQSYEPCGEPLKLMVLGASNLWFNVSISALHLPDEDPVATAVAENWDIVSNLPPAGLDQVVAGMPSLHALRGLSTAEVAAAVEAERARRETALQPDEAQPGLLHAEWELFSHPTTNERRRRFRCRPH